jgi:hypothetical protein
MARNTKSDQSDGAKEQGVTYRDSPKEQEADRYRKAAEDALQQLDWAIGYLHGIRKVDISKALAKNRSYIRQQLMGRSEEPTPSQQTSET